MKGLLAPRQTKSSMINNHLLNKNSLHDNFSRTNLKKMTEFVEQSGYKDIMSLPSDTFERYKKMTKSSWNNLKEKIS